MEPEQEQSESQGGESSGIAPIKVIRHEDYTTLYANYLYVEPTFWDLKIYFGELDLTASGTPGQLLAEMHTGMNISWPLAKVLSYLLQVHIKAHELANGKVGLPNNVVPEIPPPPSTDDPKAIEAHETFKRLRDQIITDMT